MSERSSTHDADDGLGVRALIARHPLGTGVATGLGLGLPHMLMSVELSVVVAALTLACISGIYVGFALLRGSDTVLGVELAAAVGYTLVALLGLVFSRWLIPVGLVAHSVWDVAHHARPKTLADPPTGYVPFCVVTDLVFAALLVASWIAVAD